MLIVCVRGARPLVSMSVHPSIRLFKYPTERTQRIYNYCTCKHKNIRYFGMLHLPRNVAQCYVDSICWQFCTSL